MPGLIKKKEKELESPNVLDEVEEDAPADPINLYVTTVNEALGLIVTYRPDSKLDRLKRSFCNYFGLSLQHFHFKFEDEEISDDNTPDELGMEEGDIIYVVHNRNAW